MEKVLKSRFAISTCTARYVRYISVHQVTSTQTACYRRRSILKEIARRRSILKEIARRRSIEEEKGKKKRKRKKEEEGNQEYLASAVLARLPSSLAGRSRPRSRSLFLLHEEIDRGDETRGSRQVRADAHILGVPRIPGDSKQGGIEVVGGSRKEAAINKVARCFFCFCFGGVCLCVCGRGGDLSAFGRCRTTWLKLLVYVSVYLIAVDLLTVCTTYLNFCRSLDSDFVSGGPAKRESLSKVGKLGLRLLEDLTALAAGGSATWLRVISLQRSFALDILE
ncbi:hypothetical protein GW17_00040444 [Ensete ventricosum]|nr:hypothetical protein GW17_00040444 [Ensete ventricosum]